MHTNAIDFRAKPNSSTLMFFASLFTVKDGLIFIEAPAASENGKTSATMDDPENFVFADLNGDDWFYFEDSTSSEMLQEHCAKSTAASQFIVRTISGSDTTLINFQYESTPQHKVLHEGRCNFAGLKPVSLSSQSDFDYRRSHFRSQQV
ncbi:hypothetical protein LTR28_011207 [Elasticomyces elasticus]|nr:hypothetical protein LTR28_011207 [Elasticomyces elasticus]